MLSTGWSTWDSIIIRACERARRRCRPRSRPRLCGQILATEAWWLSETTLYLIGLLAEFSVTEGEESGRHQARLLPRAGRSGFAGDTWVK